MLAETLRLNTTLTWINLYNKDLGEGGGRALAKTLLLNTTLTSLDLGGNGLGVEEQQSALCQAWGDRGYLYNHCSNYRVKLQRLKFPTFTTRQVQPTHV